MPATTRWNLKPLGLLAAVAALGLVSAALSLADHKGKPHGKPGGEDPPQPELSVGYMFTPLGTLGGGDGLARAMNNGGVVVGEADIPSGEQHAFRIFPDMDGNYGLLEDLNFDSQGELRQWVDHLGQDVTGCIAVSANDINEFDEIVGKAECDGQSRIFVFDPGTGKLILLPPSENPLEEGGVTIFGRPSINDDGDIVDFVRYVFDGFFVGGNGFFYKRGTNAEDPVQVFDLGDSILGAGQQFAKGQMDINNRFEEQVQIVTGTGYLVTLDLNTDPITIIDEALFPLLHNYAINNLGEFCGYKEMEDGNRLGKGPLFVVDGEYDVYGRQM